MASRFFPALFGSGRLSSQPPPGTTQIENPGLRKAVSSRAVTGAEPGRTRRLGVPGLILLVEDDFILRGALVELLRGEGYVVECAANGIDALARLERPPQPSLILLDIMLPHMDGIEFRTAQRSSPAIADIPVIVMSAVGLSPREADELDLHQSFPKPLDTKKLLAAIKHASHPLPA